MPSLFRRLYALLFLGFHFVIHWFRKPFMKGKGLKNFLKYYKDDQLYPIKADDRAVYSSYERCTNCGLCDLALTQIHPWFKSQLKKPSYVVNTISRNLPAFSYIDWDNFVEPDGDGSLTRCENLCPEDIPIKKLIFMMKDRAQYLEESLDRVA